jgi:hypothetical protein
LCKVIVMILFVSSDDVVKTGRAEEILLLQSELFTGVSGIIRVEDTGDVLCLLSLLNSSLVIALVESIEIEILLRARSPKSQIVGVVSVEAWNWCVVGHCQDSIALVPV